jgi:hypothetical protein
VSDRASRQTTLATHLDFISDDRLGAVSQERLERPVLQDARVPKTADDGTSELVVEKDDLVAI